MIHQPKWPTDPSGYYVPMNGAIGYETLTVDNTVRSPTPPAGTRMAKVYFRSGTMRVTMNGVNPVAATSGIPFYDGYEEYYSVWELTVMKLIREGTDNGEVHFIYYR